MVINSKKVKDDTETMYNEETLKAIEDAVNNKNMEGPFDNIKDLMESLNA